MEKKQNWFLERVEIGSDICTLLFQNKTQKQKGKIVRIIVYPDKVVCVTKYMNNGFKDIFSSEEKVLIAGVGRESARREAFNELSRWLCRSLPSGEGLASLLLTHWQHDLPKEDDR